MFITARCQGGCNPCSKLARGKMWFETLSLISTARSYQVFDIWVDKLPTIPDSQFHVRSHFNILRSHLISVWEWEVEMLILQLFDNRSLWGTHTWSQTIQPYFSLRSSWSPTRWWLALSSQGTSHYTPHWQGYWLLCNRPQSFQ